MDLAEKGLSGGRFPGNHFRYPKVGGKEALDYIKRLSKNVIWEAYSDRPLEFLYLGDEVEELISDEAEEEVIAQCTWQQLAESCLFELLSHLQLLAEDDEENAAAYREIHEEYESLGTLLYS